MFKPDFSVRIKDGVFAEFRVDCGISKTDVEMSGTKFALRNTCGNDQYDWAAEFVKLKNEHKINVCYYDGNRTLYRKYFPAKDGTLIMGHDGKVLSAHFLGANPASKEAVITRLGITSIEDTPFTSRIIDYPWRPTDDDQDYTVLVASVPTNIRVESGQRITYELSDDPEWVVVANITNSDRGYSKTIRLFIAKAKFTEEVIQSLFDYLDSNELCDFGDLLSAWPEMIMDADD